MPLQAVARLHERSCLDAQRSSQNPFPSTFRHQPLLVNIREQLVWHLLLDLFPVLSILDSCQLMSPNPIRGKITFLARYVSNNGMAL
jgi:hypothetical protein